MSDQSLKDDVNFFWKDEGAAQALKSGIRAIIEHNLNGDLKEEDAAEATRQWIYGNQSHLRPDKKRWLEYASATGTLRLNPRLRLSTLLVLCAERLKIHPKLESLCQEPRIVDFLQLADRHHQRFGERQAGIVDLDVDDRTASSFVPTSEADITLAFLTKILGASPKQLSSAAKTFFPDWSEPGDEPRIAHFVSYRFEAKPIGVFRTAITISSPTKSRPYLEFAGSMLHQDGPTDSRGIVVPMARATYLIGRLAHGDGLQIFQIPLPWFQQEAQELDDYVPGLVLSFDDGQVAIAARGILVPVNSAKEAQKRRGRADFSTALKELGPLRIEALRNRIDFDEEGNITRAGEPVDRAQIRELTQDALLAHLPAAGLKLKRHGVDSSVEDFNPAASEHYSFNGALRALSIKPYGRARPAGDGDARTPSEPGA